MNQPTRERVAFVFPGQGSQHVGMGREIHAALPEVRALFEEADDVLHYRLSQIVLEGPEEELRRTMHTQPALLLVSTALMRALGLRPAAVAGHSLGEYSALVAAGSLRFADALQLVHKRGQYMQEAVPPGRGIMLALIGAEVEKVREVLASATGIVDLSNYNAPGQIVIAGEVEATRTAAAQTGARQVVELAVSAPFHCRLMQPAEERLRVDLDRVSFSDLTTPLYNNVDARRVVSGNDARDGLARQVSRPVLWTDLIERMLADEHIETVVEIGPGTVLSGLIRRINRSVRRMNVHDCPTLEAARGALAA